MQTTPQRGPVQSPHDRLVKATLGRTEVFADFLDAFLPQLARQMALATLRREPEHFVDTHLTERVTDLLFSVEMQGRTVLTYFLFEHRSRPERLTRLDLAEYEVRIWRYWLPKHSSRTAGTELPVIVPILLYAGKRRWNFSMKFGELMGCPEGVLERFVMNFEHGLVDLSRVSLKGAKTRLGLNLVCGVLQAAAQGRLREWILEMGPRWGELMRQKNLLGMVETVLRYCVEADERQSFSKIEELAATVRSRTTRSKLMSLADKLRQEGLEKGLEKGRQEGVELGTLVGRIQTFQDLLNELASRKEDLVKMSLAELRKLAMKLQSRLRRSK